MPFIDRIFSLWQQIQSEVIWSIITLAGAILFSIVRKINHYIKAERPFYRLWEFIDDDETIFVSSIRRLDQDVVEGQPPVISSGDIDALIESIGTLKVLFPSIDLIRYFSNDMPKKALAENIISIGGPINNEITRIVLDKSDVAIGFRRNSIADENDPDLLFTPEYKSGRIVVDYGLIIRIRNPFHQNKGVMILSGCHTYGCAASAKFLSALDRNGLKHTRELMKAVQGNKSFAAIVKVDVVDEFISDPELVYTSVIDSK